METSDSFPAPSAIPVGYGPEGIAVDGEGRRGYVAAIITRIRRGGR